MIEDIYDIEHMLNSAHELEGIRTVRFVCFLRAVPSQHTDIIYLEEQTVQKLTLQKVPSSVRRESRRISFGGFDIMILEI